MKPTANNGNITVTGVSFSYVPLNIDAFAVGGGLGLASPETEQAPIKLTEKYPLRGSVESYTDPTEPVGEDDWEALE